jgi:Farnesoic acid 0-methyl transferase
MALFREVMNLVDPAPVSTPNILDANEFKSFWISWINGTISVGQGIIVGSSSFMTYTDPSPSAVNYIALSGYNTPGSVFFNNGMCHFLFYLKQHFKCLSDDTRDVVHEGLVSVSRT